MLALLGEGSVDSMPVGPRSNGAIEFRFGPMTHPAIQKPALIGEASDNPPVSAAPGVLRFNGEGGMFMRQRGSSNAVPLPSLCSGTAGMRTGKSQAITETPSLTSARLAGTGTRAAERPRDRSISPERERQFGNVRKREKPTMLRQKTPV
jgi:hypothetical protein